MPSPDLDDRPPQPKSSSGCVITLAIGGVVAFLGLLVCCGGLAVFGLNVTTAEVETQLRDNPVLIEHVGQVEQFTMNVVRSMASSDDNLWVYNVVGSKASGELTVHQVTDENWDEQILSAKLRLKDGTTVELLEAETP
jgi:hypothetical protein